MQSQISKIMILVVSAILGGNIPFSMIIPEAVAQAAPNTSAMVSNSSAVSKIKAINATAVSAEQADITEDSDAGSNDSSDASNPNDVMSTSDTSGTDTATDDPTIAESGTIGTVAWQIDSDGLLTISGGSFAGLTGKRTPWYDYRLDIKSIKITGPITVTTDSNYGYLFASLTNLTTITGLSNLSMNGVTSTRGMFYNDGRLEAVDFGQTDFSKVTTMASMFEWCSKLTKVNTTNWNVSQVKNYTQMFYQCTELTALDVSGWNTSQATTLENAFQGCSSLAKLDVSKWDTSNMTNLTSTFSGCSALAILDVSNWNTSRVTSLGATFMDCSALTILNVTNWNTSNVTNMFRLFWGCKNVTQLDVSNWKTSKVTSLGSTFYGCSKVPVLAVGNWDTSNVTSMESLFSGCMALTALDLSNWKTSSVISLSSTFFNCSGLTTLLVDGWNTSNVTKLDYVFAGCASLATLNLSSWDTRQAVTYNIALRCGNNLQHLTLGPNFDFHFVSGDNTMDLSKPSTKAPYTGKWQKDDDGPTYTSRELMASYDGATMAGTYNWEKTSGTVKVKYIDGDGDEIAEEAHSTGLTGDSYQTVAKEIAGYTLQAIPTNATGTYSDTVTTVIYVYDGNLFFKSTPTVLDFGSHALSGTTMTYAPSLDHTMEVQNNGKLNSTWMLTAELGDTGFVGEHTNKALGATLYYQTDNGQTILVPGVAAQIHSQTTANHEGIDISSGWSSRSGLLLEVPSGAALADTYHGTISWRLNSTVANN